MKLQLPKFCAVIITALSITVVQAQTPGTLDTDFGTSGFAFPDHISNAGEEYMDMITLDNDKIVMVGRNNESNADIIVTRYMSDGTVDSSFANNGLLQIDASLGLVETAFGVKELWDGKLLVTGYIANPTSWNGFIMRLNVDGTVDGTFGTSGRTEFSAGDNTFTEGRKIEVLADNSILVGGNASFGGQTDMCVFKFTQGGGVNASFGTGGVVSVDLFGGEERLLGMDLTSTGEIVLGGVADSSGVVRGVVIKLNSFGTPATFGTGGSFTFDMGNGDNWVNDVMVDANDRIVGVGHQGTAPNVDGVIFRLNNNGSLDNTFSSDGFQTSDPGATTFLSLQRVFAAPNGGVLATGHKLGAANEVYAFMMTSTGAPNTNFGSNGDATISFSISTNSVNARCAALQQNGSVVIGGTVTSQDFVGNNAFLLRLFSTGAVGIEEIVKRNLSFYPNPSVGTFRFDTDDMVDSVELIAMDGRVVSTWRRQNEYRIAATVKPGTYIVKVYGEGAVFVGRLSVVW